MNKIFMILLAVGLIFSFMSCDLTSPTDGTVKVTVTHSSSRNLNARTLSVSGNQTAKFDAEYTAIENDYGQPLEYITPNKFKIPSLYLAIYNKDRSKFPVVILNNSSDSITNSKNYIDVISGFSTSSVRIEAGTYDSVNLEWATGVGVGEVHNGSTSYTWKYRSIVDFDSPTKPLSKIPSNADGFLDDEYLKTKYSQDELKNSLTITDLIPGMDWSKNPPDNEIKHIVWGVDSADIITEPYNNGSETPPYINFNFTSFTVDSAKDKVININWDIDSIIAHYHNDSMTPADIYVFRKNFFDRLSISVN